MLKHEAAMARAAAADARAQIGAEFRVRAKDLEEELFTERQARREAQESASKAEEALPKLQFEIDRLARSTESQSQEVRELRQMAANSQGSVQEERQLRVALEHALRNSETTLQQVMELNKTVVNAFANAQGSRPVTGRKGNRGAQAGDDVADSAGASADGSEQPAPKAGDDVAGMPPLPERCTSPVGAQQVIPTQAQPVDTQFCNTGGHHGSCNVQGYWPPSERPVQSAGPMGAGFPAQFAPGNGVCPLCFNSQVGRGAANDPVCQLAHSGVVMRLCATGTVMEWRGH
ncbi:unnamed protein product [Ostreobium quekettii]|uniref:Uncharacterized protein n=1 Tax=Ostreobium quekettii TaxID=121088 RepID=A0A8S1J943_9CHLO|nr:unnamed protein product [Ostreobium quekettii]